MLDNTNSVNREFRVFISSTFRDMHDERDLLNYKIFPEIRKICWERGVNFSPVDLRWGINKEDSSRDNVLRICLEEVEKSQPFFICFLGCRYGWIPSQEQSGLSQNELDSLHNGVVRKALLEQSSMTEIEVRCGVTSSSNKIDAFFYFKNDETLVTDEPQSSKDKLQRLKNDIRQWARETNNINRLYDGYSSLEFLGNKIRDDLLRIIDDRWPLDQVPTELKSNRANHYSLSHFLRADYIADEAAISWLNEHLIQAKKHNKRELYITGPSGIGKSSLLAEWAYRLKQHTNKVFIFEYYINADSLDSDRAILKQLWAELYIDKEIPETDFQLEAGLIEALKKNESGAILILDLNQNRIANFLRDIPDNILLVTTAPEPSSKKIENTLEVTPLDNTRRLSLINLFSKRYRKNFDSNHIARLTSTSITLNPMFLKALLEELRLFGRLKAKTADEVNNEMAAILDQYLDCKDLSELFERIIANREAYLNQELLKDILVVLSISLNGLTETELCELFLQQGKHYSQRDIIEVLRLFDPYLSIHGIDNGTYHFSDSAITKAIHKRYGISNNPKVVIKIHSIIGNYLNGLPDKFKSSRLIKSIPYHFVNSHQWKKFDICCTTLHHHHKKNLYLTIDYVYENLHQIPNFSQSLFFDEIRKRVAAVKINPNTNQSDRLKVVFALNAIIYFSNRIDSIQGEEILKAMSMTIKEKRLDRYSAYVEMTMPETSTLFFFYSTINRLSNFGVASQ